MKMAWSSSLPQHMFSRAARGGRLAIGFAAGLVVSLGLLASLGAPPRRVVGLLVEATGRAQQTDALLELIPVLLIALGSGLCFRAGFWNIGGEAYFYTGALVATAVGLEFSDFPAPVLLPFMILTSGLAAATLSGLVGFMKAHRQVNEVVLSIMLNFAVLPIIAYMVRVPLRDPNDPIPYSAAVPPAARLPHLGDSRLHAGLFLVIVVAAILVYVTNGSRLGFRVRVLGANPDAGRASSIGVARTLITIAAIMGFLSGMAGMLEVSGVTYRLNGSLSPGYGYIAIIVALLGGLSPIGTAVAAWLYATLGVMSDALQVEFGIAKDVVTVLFVMMLLFMLLSDSLLKRFMKFAPSAASSR